MLLKLHLKEARENIALRVFCFGPDHQKVPIYNIKCKGKGLNDEGAVMI